MLAEIVQRTGVDMKREQSRAWMLMAALVLLAALIGGKEFWRAFRYESRQVLQEYTEKMYMPGVAYQRADETRSSKDWFREKALSWLPLVKYVSDRENLEQEDDGDTGHISHQQAVKGHNYEHAGNPHLWPMCSADSGGGKPGEEYGGKHI